MKKYREKEGIKFQFTPLREGRHRDYMALDVSELFQFTPLREGRRRHRCGRATDSHISIHAPPRGATVFPEQQHPLSWHFNSRPSARGDAKHRAPKQRRLISIHAPPRGATFP